MQNNGGYNNQHRKPRYNPGGGDGHRSGGGQNYGNNRPRKNYSANREKYLQQARDALASGDRVLAENYLQHADHCYRMMMEENANRPVRPQTQGQPADETQAPGNVAAQPEEISGNVGQLPAFLTGGFEQQNQAPVEPPVVQDWEERDSQ
jgi:hypothetical protein